MDVSTDKLLRGILNRTLDDIGLYLLESIRIVFPISFELRHQASKVLQAVASKTENNVAFAMLVAGDDHDLVTLVQTAHRPHQLRASDWHSLVNFLGKQKEFISRNNTELWIPVCLPRFHSSGLLYGYTKCLHVPSKLALILLTSDGTTEQFQILRGASQLIQKELQLPANADTILTIVETTEDGYATTSSSADDVAWKRKTNMLSDHESSSMSMDSTSEDDYVQISSDMFGNNLSKGETENKLLVQLQNAKEAMTVDNICKRYLDDVDEPPMHFIFRLDIPVKSPSELGHLSQCISPSLAKTPTENDSYVKQILWSSYQKLSLRLRLGSASVEATMDALDMINDSCNNGSNGDGKSGQASNFPGIGEHCPAIGLFECPVYASDGLSYIIDGDLLFLGMNGKDFEL
jgi:Second Longin domain of FUZ, MON1 and HPS1